MEVDPCLSVKVVAEIVVGSMDSLKVAVTVLPTDTAVSLSNGSVAITIGAAIMRVLKVHTNAS